MTRFKVILTLLSLIALTNVLGQSITPIDGIVGWNIKTNNSVYQLGIQNGEIIPLFYGAESAADQLHKQTRSRHNGPYALAEVPVRGRYADKMPIVEAVFEDNTRDIELEYVDGRIVDIDGRQTLVITQRDTHYPLTVESYMRVLPEYDIIEKWLVVKNTSSGKKAEKVVLDNLLSGSLLLTPSRYFLTHHSGQWLRDFQLRKTELTSGVKNLCARDFFSFQNTPWFVLSTTPDDDRYNTPVWFGQVHYSGNWRIDFELTHSNHLQIVGGVNFWDTALELSAQESYTTPKFSFGYTPNGSEHAAQLTSAYVRNEILPQPTRKVERPVLYNSWYATTFDVRHDHQLALAKVARELGVELFVIDDGWFTNRQSDQGGLGDWEVDPQKFPQGLGEFVRQVNDLGLDVGIWVEPEMINKKSELYKKHPDWILSYPNREKTEWRYQLTLNLAREDVYQYLYAKMRALIKDSGVKFIKWDRNRGLTQPGWSSAPKAEQREVRLRYMANLYRMIDALKAEFPDVIFETCSSGGGRPDLGMLERMDQTWISDNTDPIDRLFIQYGYLSSYPANTMVCWTNSWNPHRFNMTLEYVFDVAMQGVLGIGQDITKWSEAQKEIAKRKIEQYKSYRHIIQYGEVCRLFSPYQGNRVAIQYTTPSSDEILVMCYNLGETMEGTTLESQANNRLKLRGIDPSKQYSVDGGAAVSGQYLLDYGLAWPLSGVYTSKILYLRSM